MIDYFHRKMREEGAVKASINWKPACSFLEDTCEKLQEIAFSWSPGLYMIDSNERWNFFEIATALNQLHANSWSIVKTEEAGMDTRMIDGRVKMPSLSERLSLP
jgi:dTDP-4-dehydrorhamnose reductase